MVMNQGELFEERADNVGIKNAPEGLAEIFELSVDAYYAALYAHMSELPIKGEISRFIAKVGKAKSRASAEKAAFDRSDPDVFTVLKAAGKVQHEIHRLQGLLRFSPNPAGEYIARCAPDHYVLPAIAEHFTLRFGENSWAIVDEKRKLRLSGGEGRAAGITQEIKPSPKNSIEEGSNRDFWEDLWRLYHRSINIETRKNSGLQNQFMPKRYHKYLPELE